MAAPHGSRPQRLVSCPSRATERWPLRRPVPGAERHKDMEQATKEGPREEGQTAEERLQKLRGTLALVLVTESSPAKCPSGCDYSNCEY